MAYLNFSQVNALVAANNKSTYSNSIVLCQIYKESRFDPNAKSTSPNSSATGLMQMTKTALTELNRVKKTSFKHEDMTTPVVNIQAGTMYLQICVMRRGGGAAGLNYYGTGSPYANKILAAAEEIDALPRPITAAAAMAILVKQIGKQ